MAANALIQALRLPVAAAKAVLEKAARIIQYHQKRNAQARKSHTKTRNKKLAAMGIDMSTIKRCNWDTS
jgi:isoaspartyl peptidase/L-asparaginase-like protein (Ntn-hydrolase superfamily)